MKENELAKPVIAWLEVQHWDVYQEVQFGRGGKVADIVAVRNNLVWIIECKTTFSLSVMEQAYSWRSHYRSIAIPTTQRNGRRIGYELCRNYFQIGVLEVEARTGRDIYEHLSPPLKREYHKFAKDMRKYLSPEHKVYAQAGSSNGGHFTPYRKTMDTVKRYIAKNPGCTLKEIIDNVGRGHYAHTQSAKGTIRTALVEWENWCRVDMQAHPYRYYIEVIK